MGYSGGRCENPSFENFGDHAKVVMVEYDPLTLSYGQLLDIFFNCCIYRESESSQFISYIFVKNEFEKRLAQAAVARYELRSGNYNCVKIAMHRNFYKAEDWCQKYCLRMLAPLMDELKRIYPNEEWLIQSALATRLNGILGRRSFREPSAPCFPEDFEFYDLSNSAVDILKGVMELPSQ